MTEIATFQTPTYTHAHHLSLKSLTWVTLGITAVMGGLFFAVGFPPAFDTFYEKMYFHSIGIGIAAMLAYLMLETFRLEDYEPPIDFPIRYRAFLAVVFGAIGGLFALSPSIWTGWPDVGMLFFVAAFVLVADVGGAMLVELIVLPRKKAGVYHGDSRNIIDYVWRLVPLTAADRAPYRGLSSAYWLAVISLASACVAALIGFINLWVRAFGPSIFGGFYGLFGYNQQGILDATLDPHSHMIALAIFGGIVAVAVLRFRALESDSRVRRLVASAGTWIALIGVIGTTLILGAVAFLNYAPPTLFASPDGVNGMAGDDLVMSIVFLGAVVVAVAVLADRAFWRNGLRLTIVGTWLGMVAITVLEGFYIEMNQTQFAGPKTANDAAFSAAHPMTGIFLMIGLSLALLLLDFAGVTGRARQLTIAVGATGLVAAVAGTTLWTFVDPSNTGPLYWLYIGGIAIAYLAILAAAVTVRSTLTGNLEQSKGKPPVVAPTTA
ncbi:MAG TPA: hypothetical protein VKR30_12865 [Candidatus Limnocylindrales bacterium]|nr:hypothetical protein [Candidatus Limnocylindrales bacterium]